MDAFIIRYNYDDVPTVKRFIQSRKKYKLIIGPLGSGKSSGCVMHLFNTMLQQEPNSKGVRKTRYAIVRNTSKQLRDTTKKTIDDWIPPSLYEWKEAAGMYIFRFKLEDGTIVESEWLLRPLDDPKQVRDLLSLELTGAWINEGKEVREDIFKMLRGRIGRYPPKREVHPTYPYIIIDSNPPDTEHWLYKLFEELPHYDERWRSLAEVFRQPSGLSPEAENIRNLPEGYYEDLCIGQDEDWIRVYVHGEYGYVKTGKPVFPNYKDNIHCAKEILKPIRALPLIIGMDFGLYPAAVFTQHTERGQLRVIEELVSEEPTDLEQFVTEALIPKLNSSEYFGMEYLIIGDPAGTARSQIDKRTCFSVLKKYGFKAYPAYTNALHDRIMAVNFYLTRMIDGEEPAFLLSPKCKVLRKALISEYKFRRLRTSGEKYADVPEKNFYSHCIEASVNVSLPDGYKPIKEIKVGDVVLTPQGAKRVTNVMKRKVDSIRVFKFSNLYPLVCTDDHFISTVYGWMKALDICPKCGVHTLLGILKPNFITTHYGSFEVYDLTVEDAHCFYANGVLVHNCADALQYACLGFMPNFGGRETIRYGHRNIILQTAKTSLKKYKGFV